MRVWLYDLLSTAPSLQGYFYGDPTRQVSVHPRESLDTTLLGRPFIVYGLGNDSNEALSEDPGHEAHRQFFQVWVHDGGGDFDDIDSIVGKIKTLLINAHDSASHVSTVLWLETSQEFSDQTFGTIFRYVRFQAIISKGVSP